MIITIYETIVFHVSEWIDHKTKNNTRPLVWQGVSHNAWKSWRKVKRKPTPSKDIKINITPRYLYMV